MSVRAKFFVQSIERFTYADSIVVKAVPVTRKEGDNATWATATPSGMLQMTINNKDAWPFFLEKLETGGDMWLDFSDADTAHPNAAKTATQPQ